MRSIFASTAGVAIMAWWAATWLVALPTELQPVQRQASHVVAEILIAILLLIGAGLQRTDSTTGRLVMAAAFGGLLYASVNVLGDFADRPAMLAVLVLAAAASVAALASMVWDSLKAHAQ
ncbi:MAG: hypothetical protein OEV43_06260 [Coriobacteriia bacterium]|nr:hypothetical protein [Coriobacteriia bacterium]